MKRLHSPWVRVFLAALAVLAPFTAPGVEQRTTNDGVYTFTQALRGESDYRRECVSCHMEDLQGNGQWVPGLAGDSFVARWSGHSLADLFRFIQSTMPQTAPRSLSAGTYADIVAYILSANGLPAGKRELKPDMESLKTIRFMVRS